MDIRLKIVFSIVALSLLSCSVQKIPKEDIAFNPYKSGNVLIFKSNLGAYDTIFITDVKTIILPGRPMAVFPRKSELLMVIAKRSNPSFSGYIENSIIEIDTYNIYFDFFAKNAKFYGGSFNERDEIERLPEQTLSVNGQSYHDVVILESKENEYSERENFIDKIFWSKSKGFIKYNLRNGVIWELEKQYCR